MRSLIILISFSISLLFYKTVDCDNNYSKIIAHIPLPDGYIRVKSKKNSFAHWLRTLPLKKAGSPVKLFNGTMKENQDAHYAVVQMSVGKRNLQQCADAIMRLRAEYLFFKRKYKNIKFSFTSGDLFPFVKWAAGYRPIIRSNNVRWKKKAARDFSYKNLKRYLAFLFIYAGTASLSREMIKVNIKNINIGNVFIQGGFPGHAVIIVDMAYNIHNGTKIFLLAQSYMPAQEIHILKNPSSRQLSPWYKSRFRGKLLTPEWDFRKSHLKKFKQP
ncbi:DUF4846 domain-containing protein [Spirochaetota bacterium]